MTSRAAKREHSRKNLASIGMVPISVWIPDSVLSRAKLRRFVDGECTRHLASPCPDLSIKKRIKAMMGWKQVAYRGISGKRMVEFLSSPVGISSIFAYVTDTDEENSPDPDLWERAQMALSTGNKDLLVVVGVEIWEQSTR